MSGARMPPDCDRTVNAERGGCFGGSAVCAEDRLGVLTALFGRLRRRQDGKVALHKTRREAGGGAALLLAADGETGFEGG